MTYYITVLEIIVASGGFLLALVGGVSIFRNREDPGCSTYGVICVLMGCMIIAGVAVSVFSLPLDYALSRTVRLP